MKSETKENIIMICFTVLVIFNILAVGVNIGSCICTVGDIECVEACEQRDTTNHTISFVANIMSAIATVFIIKLWSDKK